MIAFAPLTIPWPSGSYNVDVGQSIRIVFSDGIPRVGRIVWKHPEAFAVESWEQSA